MAREETLPLLRELLHSDEPYTQLRAVRTLEGWWSPGEEANEQERLAFYLFRSVQPPAPTGFTTQSLPTAAALLRRKDRPGSWRAARRAIDVLASIGAPAVEPIIGALVDPDYRVRAVASLALGRLKDARSLKPLIALLSDEDSRVRQAAARALGHLCDARSLESLRAFTEDKNEDVRMEVLKAIECLESSGHP